MKNVKKIGLILMGVAFALTLLLCTKTSAYAISKGDVFEHESVKYKITKLPTQKEKGTCTVVNVLDNAKKIYIYKTIKTEGAELICNSISYGAFTGKKNLTSVKLSEASPITTLPSDCFKNCVNLKTVILANGQVKTFGANSFKNCSSLKTLATTNKKMTQKSFGKGCFSGTEDFTFYAPTKTIAKKYVKYASKRGASKETAYAKYLKKF